MTQASPSPHAGGEEWRDMDTVDRYLPSDADLAASNQRIRDIRMRDVTIRLVDHRGEPLANTPVSIDQQQHAFAFGDNLWRLDTFHRENAWDTDRARWWRRRFADVFNAANALCYWTERPRNDGPKTEDHQGEPRYDGFARCVDWARSEGMQVKGHPLFWSIQKCVPEWVKRYDYQTQMKFVEVRVRSLTARFGRGRVSMWDVINEALWEPAFKNLPQRDWPHLDPIPDIADYIEPVIRWVRDEDPAAAYILNDYGLEAGRDLTASDGTAVTVELQRQRMIELAAELQQRGVSPSGIGLQSHTGGFLTKAAQQKLYDTLEVTGLPMQITEFWLPRESLKAIPEDERSDIEVAYARDFLTHAFAHPAINAFFFWGFMGWAIDWRESGGGNDPRPVYDAVRSLIHETWSTHEAAVTDRDGVVQFRGYFGRYTLSYDLPAASDRQPSSLPTCGGRDAVTFELTPEAGGPLTLTTPLASVGRPQ